MSRLRLLLFLFAAAWALAGCAGRGDAPPPVLFLRAVGGGAPQLFLQPGATASARQLTGASDTSAPEVIDYAASPDGKRVVYAVTHQTVSGEMDGTALRIVGADGRGDGPLLDCPAAECASAVWSPDGGRLLYERRPIEDGRPGSPRLYWLDPATGETLPLIEGDETPGSGARFSPDGTWLSYVSPSDEGVVLYRLSDGLQRRLISRAGRPAAFSPDGAAVVISDIVVQGDETAPASGGVTPVQESSSVYLYRVDLDGEANRVLLSPPASIDDSAPAWSPDGAWIAFGRTPANTAAGRQLWLMQPDGSEARALTADPSVAHGPPSWSPDGRYLLFQRYDLDDPSAAPSVWRLEVATGEEERVAEGGGLPSWLPSEIAR